MLQPIRLAVVAPASNADPEKVLRGVERLRALGHTLKLMPHVLTQAWPYFAATAEQRLDDLHAAFADPEIDAVICIRGGYGSTRITWCKDRQWRTDLAVNQLHRRKLLGYVVSRCVSDVVMALASGCASTVFVRNLDLRYI